MQIGAIILCGGKSTRMGRDKATLPFGPECMLQRIVRLLSDVIPVNHMVVVAAVNQELPELPSGITVARDQRPERGPLEGLAAGWRAMPAHIDAAYATSCDVPLLMPEFVWRMFALLEEPPHPNSLLKNVCREGEAPVEPQETSDFPHVCGSAGASPSLFQQAVNPLPRGGGEGTAKTYDIAVPRDGEHHHPLAAVYRRTVLDCIQKLLDADRLRPRFLFDEMRTREIFVDDLRSVDPQLDTLKNLNTPDDYQAALRAARVVPIHGTLPRSP